MIFSKKTMMVQTKLSSKFKWMENIIQEKFIQKHYLKTKQALTNHFTLQPNEVTNQCLYLRNKSTKPAILSPYALLR